MQVGWTSKAAGNRPINGTRQFNKSTKHIAQDQGAFEALSFGPGLLSTVERHT